MTWFHDDFLWLPANPDEFDSYIYLRVDDGWRIWLEMGDCTSPDTYHSACPCGRGEEVAEEHFRELSLEELKELRSACDNAILMVEEKEKKKSIIDRFLRILEGNEFFKELLGIFRLGFS